MKGTQTKILFKNDVTIKIKAMKSKVDINGKKYSYNISISITGKDLDDENIVRIKLLAEVGNGQKILFYKNFNKDKSYIGISDDQLHLFKFTGLKDRAIKIVSKYVQLKLLKISPNEFELSQGEWNHNSNIANTLTIRLHETIPLKKN